MTTYKDIHGTQVEVRSDDPSNPVNGQIWYNTTDLKLRGFSLNPVGAWSTGGNLNTARNNFRWTGTQTAGLAVGGESPSGNHADTELYNGASWTEVNNLNTARFQDTGAGTATAGLVFGGQALVLLQRQQKIGMAQIGQK